MEQLHKNAMLTARVKVLNLVTTLKERAAKSLCRQHFAQELREH